MNLYIQENFSQVFKILWLVHLKNLIPSARFDSSN